MKKFKLIKEYPGSPKLDTEIIKSTIYGASSTKVVHSYMIKGNETFQLNNPKDYPEFWQEIVEKDYEILSFICNNKKLHYNKNLKSFNYKNNDGDTHRTLEFMLKNSNTYKIHSVKRLSDGEIFTVGDKIFPNNKIYKFEIKDDILKIWHCDISFSTPIIEGPSGQPGNCSWIEGINNLKKIKQPLFTTEDGVDIFNKNTKVYELFPNSSLLSELKYDFTNHYLNYTPKTLIFSTKEKAEEYILMNKPCLSLKEIKENTTIKGLSLKKLQKLVQQKLNK